MKVSVALTVLNEGADIRNVIGSLLNQTHKPDEIIICDGGSKDETIPRIKEMMKEGVPVKLIVESGACRGAGRNRAIEAANNPIVALIDGGTTADPKWLENLLSPCITESSIEVVYGAVIPRSKERFSKCLAPLLIGASNRDGKLCPSVASLLFKKKVWKEVGGFPEGLTTAEDLIFIDRLKKHDMTSSESLDAVVYWSIPSSIGVIFNRFSSFSQGGLAAGFAKRWHYGTVRNFIIYGLLTWAAIALTPWLFISLPSFHILRVHRYLSKMPCIKRNGPLDNIYDYTISGFILLIMDIATLNGLWHWILYDHCRRQKISCSEGR